MHRSSVRTVLDCRLSQHFIQLHRSVVLFRSLATQSENTSESEHHRATNIDAEHAALIDTSSLRNTLESIREANRTRLIRKIDEHGVSRPLSLPDILGKEKRKLSRDAAAIARASRRNNKASWKEKSALDRAKIATAERNVQTGASAAVDAKVRSSPIERASQPPGRIVDIAAEWKASDSLSAHSRAPWLQRLGPNRQDSHLSALGRLDAEIRAFEEFFTPNEAEEVSVRAATADLRQTLNDLDKRYGMSLVGSQVTGLASPFSDIDVNLEIAGSARPDVVEGRGQSLANLRELRKDFQRIRGYRAFRQPFLVHRAKVPVLGLTHVPTGLEVQIQSNNSGYNTTQYAKLLPREFPSVKGLFHLLRQALRIRGLTEGSLGGLTSYPLLIMIVASLKQQEANHAAEGVGTQLLHFLKMFSEIDFHSTGLSISPLELIDLNAMSELDRSLLRRHEPGQMYLLDPADPSNNLGKALMKTRDLQATIIAWLQSLNSDMVEWDKAAATSPGPDTTQISLLRCLVEADYSGLLQGRAMRAHSVV